jgi:hypothetical protein
MDHALRHANPFVAAYYGLSPKLSLWMGIRKAQNALKRKEDLSIADVDVRRALDLAASIRVIWPTVAEWKKKEVRSRLLGDEDLEPILLEMKTALDLLLSGHQISWIEPSQVPGQRTADLLAVKDSFEFEVECKAQSADEGRKIARSAMHGFCYKLASAILGDKIKGVWREITVRVPDRFSPNQDWQDELVAKIITVNNGGSVKLGDGTQAQVDLGLAPNHLPMLRQRNFEHVCVLTMQPDGSEPTLTIRCGSMRPDKMLAAIEEDLSDASRQLSGARPGRIVCYIPEVPSFVGMNTLDSGVAQMTYHFFKVHKGATTVFEVDYVSDTVLTAGQAFDGTLHFLRFRNPDYIDQASDRL